ncbi:MAG: SMP-30/gluconolactonase/LRE family protein, partial [Alphaproteobacteria bacterium]|nr:SMP-30/gluconolactonase/LRE family protein [Alphaproteobacteria bacterium]
MNTPALLLDVRADLGEGPRWHAAEQRLYWVDINARTLHRFDPATGRDEQRKLPQRIGCFAFSKSGGVLLAMEDGFDMISGWDAPLIRFGGAPLAGKPDLRFNDGRTDHHGTFWVGSVNMKKSANNAALYALAPDGTCTEIEGGMLTCNGAAFSADGCNFMHTDTPSHALRLYDVADGALTNRRIFHQFEMGTGRPDGGSFDEEGYYWSALFDGGRVVRLSPAGEVVQTVVLPVSRPTMIAFGEYDRRT